MKSDRRGPGTLAAEVVPAKLGELTESAKRLAAAAEKTKAITVSAERMTDAAEQTKDSADRRTELAADRTVLAAERTYASWVQLGLGSLAAGIGAKKLLAGVVPEWMIVIQGTLLVVFSVFCFGAAVWRQMTPGVPPPEPDVRRIPWAVLVTVNGMLGVVAISALISIWFGRTNAN